MTATERIRRKLGLSQSALAALAGVNQSSVSRWERGEGEPSLSEARKITLASQGTVVWADFFEPAQTGAQTP